MGDGEGGDAADEALVEGVATGDELARRRFVERFRRTIQAVATIELKTWRHGRMGPYGRDDLVNEVFLALFAHRARALRRFESSRGSLDTFIFVFTRSRIREIATREIRRQGILGRPVRIEDVNESTGTDRRPDEIVEARDLAIAVIRCVRAYFTTELGQRMVELILVRLLGLDEVESESGMSRRQVYQWRSRVFLRARECRDELFERPRADES